MADTNNEVTAWEEINPPMVSVPRQGPGSQSLADDTRIVFRNELTACLSLTAPAGMTEEGRRDWLAVAWDTLKHIPADILARGARKAREKCDHPSKIVPFIVEATREDMRLRREYPPVAERIPAERQIERRLCTPTEAAEILAGLKCMDRDDAAASS